MSNLIFIKDNDNNVGIGSNMINDIKGNINITQNLNVAGNVNIGAGTLNIGTNTQFYSFGSNNYLSDPSAPGNNKWKLYWKDDSTHTILGSGDANGTTSLAVGGTEVLIAKGSKVGIGIANPTEVLDVSGNIKSSGSGSFDSITTTTDTGVIFSDGTNSSTEYRNGNILKYGTPTTNSSLELKIRAAGYTESSLNLESECRNGTDTPELNLKAWTQYAGSLEPVVDLQGGGGVINIETFAGYPGSGAGRAKGKVNIKTEICCIQGAGYTPKARVGINTSAPICSLHVSETTYLSTADGHALTSSGSSYVVGTTATTSYVIAKIGDVYITNYYVLNTSDRRIKTNIVDVPDNLALQQLRTIPCRYYEYIDKLKRDPGKTIGFIAQEVKSVLPMAVTQQVEIIPNVYKVINCTWTSNADKFNMSSSDLSNVSDVKYRFYVSNTTDSSDEKMVEITGNSDNTFTFDAQYTNVFCYGSEVDDFHTLDKNKLFTLNFSATQEIDKIQQTHITEIASLKTEVSTLKTENAELKSIIDKLKTANSFEEFKNSL